MHATDQAPEAINEQDPTESAYRDPLAEHTSPLTPQQVHAAHLLSLGHSYHEVSHNLSVGRTTLYRWRQLPEFTAYLNILLRQTADEITLQTTCLLTAALKLIKDKLNDPATKPHEQIRLALRLLHLYSSPSFLKFLNNRSDCSRGHRKQAGVRLPSPRRPPPH